MTLLPRGLKVHLALGYTDMRKGIDGLTMLVQGVLRQDPFSGHLFVFRGRKANLIKIVYWDGTSFQRNSTRAAIPYRRATSERLAPDCPACSTMRRLSASLKVRRWPSRAGGMMSGCSGEPLVI